MRLATAMLKDVALINPSLSDVRLDDDDAVSFVPMSSLSAETASIESESTRSCREVKKGYTPFLDGDVLFAKITPCFENGKIGQARITHAVGFGSTEFHVIRPRGPLLDGRYLHHFLRLDRVRNAGIKRMTGSAGQQRVPKAFLETLEIPTPPLDEQRRIAALLDKAEELRAKRRAALALLDQFPNAIFFEMFGDPKNNERSWPRRALGDLAQIRTGGTPSRTIEANYGGAIPWVKTGEVNGQPIRSTEESLTEAGLRNSNCQVFPAGSVVVAMYGQGKTRGRCSTLEIEATTNQACAVVLPSDKLFATFLFAQLSMSYERLRDLGRGGNQPNLNLSLVSGFEVIVPPIVEQHRFDRRVETINHAKAAHQSTLVKLDALFASLQNCAFAGEL